MDAKQLEDTLRSSNFIYEQAWKAGHLAGKREAYAEFQKIIKDAEKNALLGKQAT